MTDPIKPARIVQRDPLDRCAMCGAAISVWTLKNGHPEAPELVNLPPNAWLGVVKDDAGVVTVVMTCCHACAQALLAEGDPL